ncbi:helix-turn-helix domain-containing protein [Streptomyces sp. NBC_01136]|uniref:helix-turn-helix domain-containing protein n=1 Tax=unclassified Streptomyces TaxID=2593676 RepID=UPI003248CA40|nr:helix-turn-helix domain-containing protein [Streptomyces sp. NBC_01136]WST81218.1 helix-turn-helix domain-containing protein [Streptomyces sp. NBC_01136]
MGPTGSGKTTYAKRRLEPTGAVRLSVDELVHARHDSQLLVSARTWMERDRRTEAAAAALHIHPNTLAYRRRRFGALADRDPTSTGALAEVWLAIQAAGALGLTD